MNTTQTATATRTDDKVLEDLVAGVDSLYRTAVDNNMRIDDNVDTATVLDRIEDLVENLEGKDRKLAALTGIRLNALATWHDACGTKTVCTLGDRSGFAHGRVAHWLDILRMGAMGNTTEVYRSGCFKRFTVKGKWATYYHTPGLCDAETGDWTDCEGDRINDPSITNCQIPAELYCDNEDCKYRIHETVDQECTIL